LLLLDTLGVEEARLSFFIVNCMGERFRSARRVGKDGDRERGLSRDLISAIKDKCLVREDIKAGGDVPSTEEEDEEEELPYNKTGTSLSMAAFSMAEASLRWPNVPVLVTQVHVSFLLKAFPKVRAEDTCRCRPPWALLTRGVIKTMPRLTSEKAFMRECICRVLAVGITLMSRSPLSKGGL
jgi:hypothetical protein